MMYMRWKWLLAFVPLVGAVVLLLEVRRYYRAALRWQRAFESVRASRKDMRLP